MLLAKKKKKQEMYIKMMYNITTSIKNAFQYQMVNFNKWKTAIAFAPI